MTSPRLAFIEETYPLITSIANIEAGLIVSLNRMEAGKRKLQLRKSLSWGMPTAAIVSMDEAEALTTTIVDGILSTTPGCH